MRLPWENNVSDEMKQAESEVNTEPAEMYSDTGEIDEDGVRFRAVYHGSPHGFDAFDHSHIGEGEGNQTYGWGTYVTEVNGIARMYAEGTTFSIFKDPIGKSFERILKMQRDEGVSFKESKAALLKQYRSMYEECRNSPDLYGGFIKEYERLERMTEEELPVRNLYTVEIPDDSGLNYLNWSNEIDGAERDRVIKLLSEQDTDNFDYDYFMDKLEVYENEYNLTGEGLYRLLSKYGFENDMESASRLLNNIGFVGIEYLAEAQSGGRADGAKNYVIFNEKDAEIMEHSRFRETGSVSAEAVNERFNEELDEYESGKLGSEKVFNLGKPQSILRSAGLQDKEITMNQSVLSVHLKKHGLTVDDMKDLASAVQNPIMVYEWGGKAKSLVVITDLSKGEHHITAAIKLERKGQRLEVNEVASVHGKSVERLVSEMIHPKKDDFGTDLLRYVNKEKALDWLSSASSPLEPSAIINQELSSATNILQNFENPSIVEGEISSSIDNLSEELGVKVNERFNEELQQQIAGKLPKGHVYQLGRPSGVLLSAGIPSLPIELSASKLETKSSSDYESNHPFELKEVKNLPEAISNPIAVFDSKTKFGHKVILTELKSGENNFVVAMQINSHPKGFQRNIEVNSIRSIYPKDNVKDIVSWINRGDLLRYADKNKILNWVTQQRSNSAEVAIPNKDSRISSKIQQQSNSADVTLKDINVATNILQNFENPSIVEGEISSVIDNLSEDLGVKVNKAKNRKELPEGIRRQMKGGRYPGLYDPKTGEVWVVLDEILDAADAQATVLHEIVGHKGIRGLFGDRLPDFCERVLKSMPEDDRAKLIDKYKGDQQLAAEEYVASFAEGYKDPSAWERVKAIVKELLWELGIDLKLSDNDLKYVLWKGKNGLREGDGMLDVAAKIAKAREVERELFRNESGRESPEEVNRRFNEKIDHFTEDNALSTIFDLGSPSEYLLSAGIQNKPIRLYGSKVLKKIKKHGFEIEELRDLPNAVANPIAVFNNVGRNGNRSVLTNLKTVNGNFLVTVDLGKGTDADFDVVSSVFGKSGNGVLSWINKGFATYIDKEKALNYLRISAPIAEASNNSELSSATNIVKNFENPKRNVEKSVLFREADLDLVEAEDLNEAKEEKIVKPSLTQTDIIADLQSQMLNDRVSGKLIAGRLSMYVRGVFGKDLVEAMGKKQFDAIVKEIEQATQESKMPEESRLLIDERKDLVLQFYKEFGNKEASARIGSRIKDIDRSLNDLAKESLRKPMYRIADVVTDIELKRQTERLDKLVHLKVAGKNRHGVSVAKTVDEETKVALHYIRDYVGRDMTQEIAELSKKQSEADHAGGSISNEDGMKLKSAMVLQQFFATDNSHELIEDYKKRVEELRMEVTKTEGEIEAEKWKEEPDKRCLAALRKKVRNKKQEIKYSAYAIIDDRHRLSQKMIKLNDLIEDLIYEGKGGFFDWVNEESTRRSEIVREAMRDMDTRTKRKIVLDDQETFTQKTMRFIKKHLLSSAWSFDYLVKHLSQRAMNGEGEFYDRIMKGEDGLVEASGNFWKGRLDFMNEVEAKSAVFFGKKYEAAMMDSDKELDGVILTVNDGETAEEDIHPTIGQGLYVVMLNKMTDGAVKLRQKGITDEDICKLKSSIPACYLKWADWVQEEFLPEKRKKYNDTHVRIFGSSMAEIDHYFPLRVQKQNVYKEVDMSKSETEGLPSGITGSIINRKPNRILPAFKTNALELLLEHGREMEHWSAYTRVVHDLNGLLSSTAFRNMLEEREKGLFGRFRAASTIAVEAYCPKDDDLNKLVVAVSKGYTGAKINFRLNTALKQVLSAPAFYSYAFDAGFALKLTRNVSPDVWRENWKWGMENLPLFEKRWRERSMGNEKLGDDGVKWIDDIMDSKFVKAGMWPNAFVDGMTCVNGAKAVYDYRVESYRGVGVSEGEAQRRAKIDAVLSFNQTQQSNEGFMLAEMQKKRDLWNAGLSVFNNSTFLYLRQTMEGVKELTRNVDQEMNSRKRVLMKMGVAEEKAEVFAKRDVYRMKRTAIAKVGIMGVGMQVIWGLGSGAWNYLWALFTDDDDSKEVLDEMTDVMLKSALIGPIRGTSYGGQLESFIDGYDSNVIGLPMFDDFKDFFKLFRKSVSDGAFNPVIAYEAFRLVGEGVSGVDLNTVVNAYIGIEDAVKSGGVRAENIGYFLNAPKSQVRLLAERRRGDESLMDYVARIGRLDMEVRLGGKGGVSDRRKKDLKDKYRLSPYERAKRKEFGRAKSAVGKVNGDRGLSIEEKVLKRGELREERDVRVNGLKEMYEVMD